jgi:hypothetical protein
MSEKSNIFSIVKDFVKDLCNTFPEITNTLHEGLLDIMQEKFESEQSLEVVSYLEKMFPKYFFDILNKNEEIFKENIFLLPNIDFSLLWKEDISENTKSIIWKYLLLICFSVVSKTNNFESFGEEAEKIFENLNEDEFKDKINEALKDVGKIFENNDSSNINLEDLPNADQMHKHFNGLLDSKLGKLAHEIAEETAGSLNLENATSIDDVVKNLMSNPGSLASLVKNVTNKLDEKIKSGDLNENELMEDANSILQNMSSIPGLGNMNNLFNMMSKGNMGNINKAGVQQNLSKMNTKERLRKKLEERKKVQEENVVQVREEKNWKGENIDDVVEKTPRTKNSNKNKKKKKKNNNRK